MGSCLSSNCKSEASWKPFITTSVQNVVVNTLVTEPTLWMVKDCPCKKCAKVNKREPTHEEALRHGKLLDEAKRTTDDSKRRSIAISPGSITPRIEEVSKR